MPCYDFCHVTDLTLIPTSEISGITGFLAMTGSEYRTRERIHRGVADPRLLAIPTSRRRVAASDLNWGVIYAISMTLQFRFALCTPL